jgi:hypothetical protein
MKFTVFVLRDEASTQINADRSTKIYRTGPTTMCGLEIVESAEFLVARFADAIHDC